ncbi:MAG: site-specific integrase, partial [Clostridia bacterium]|nr:site-specific integrase [Clostridia bacterium]
MKPTNFSRHLSDFFSDYLTTQKNVSKNTIYSYRDTFKLLLKFCQ